MTSIASSTGTDGIHNVDNNVTYELRLDPELLVSLASYVKKEWRVFPLYPVDDGACACPDGARCDAIGKHPHIRGWGQEATTDWSKVIGYDGPPTRGRSPGWWSRWSNAGIGIATGRASGLVVLDVDGDVGEDSLRQLEHRHGELPITVEVVTGGGGRHIYFKTPETVVHNGVASVGPGLDIRAEGGFVVAPPSVHRSGVRYEWEVTHHPDYVELAELPGWILADHHNNRTGTRNDEPVDVERILSDGVPKGSRNMELTRYAGRLRGLGVSIDEARVLLLRAAKACKPPLHEDETIRILESVWSQNRKPVEPLEPVDLRGLLEGDAPAADWFVEPFIPTGKATGLISKRGEGKSLLSLDVVARRASGQLLFGVTYKPCHVIYIDQEMGPDDLYDRLNDLGWSSDSDAFARLEEHLHYYQLVDLPPLDTEAGGDCLEELVRRHSAKLVVIDTVSRVVEGDENPSDTWRALYRHTEVRLKRAGISLLRLDHLGKEKERGSRGSSAKEDTLDVVWQLIVNRDVVELARTKGRQPWIPEKVWVERKVENGVTTHTLPGEGVVPDWVKEVAADLDALDVEKDAGVNVCVKALKDAGKGRRRADVSQVVRYRQSIR